VVIILRLGLRWRYFRVELKVTFILGLGLK
jgi:hypothetical protein